MSEFAVATGAYGAIDLKKNYKKHLRLALILAVLLHFIGILYGHTERYRRIRFDDVPFHSPLAYYPYSLMTYSYGKILLTPGQRLGYIAMPPTLSGFAPGRSIPKAWAMRARMKRIAAPQSHRLPPVASSRKPSRTRKIGIFSA